MLTRAFITFSKYDTQLSSTLKFHTRRQIDSLSSINCLLPLTDISVNVPHVSVSQPLHRSPSFSQCHPLYVEQQFDSLNSIPTNPSKSPSFSSQMLLLPHSQPRRLLRLQLVMFSIQLLEQAYSMSHDRFEFRVRYTTLEPTLIE